MDEASPVLTAVLAALARVREQQEVLLLGAGANLRWALEAGSGRDLVDKGPADVIVAISATDVPDAMTMLKRVAGWSLWQPTVRPRSGPWRNTVWSYATPSTSMVTSMVTSPGRSACPRRLRE